MIRERFIVVLLILVFSTVSTALAQDPQLPDIGGRIVFTSDRNGSCQLWVYDFKSKETTCLTDIPGDSGFKFISYPRWSPNGKMIVFCGRKGEGYSYEIFIINDDGSGLKQITNYPTNEYYAQYIAWDPNSIDYLYYTKHRPPTGCKVHKIYFNSLENDNDVIDIEIPNFSGEVSRLCDITSDGREYLFIRERQCCWTPYSYMGYQDFEPSYEIVIKASDNHAERIARINRKDNWIVYPQSINAWAPTNLFKMDKSGNNVTQLTFGSGNEENYNPCWTNDHHNGYIIFDTNMFGNIEIVLMKALATEYPGGIINLTNNPATDRFPDWTPFSSNQPPVALCKNIQVAADERCEAFITVSDVDGGSYDPDENDEITLSLDKTGPFSLGTHYVELTVVDQNGESDSCISEIEVKDQISPVISISDPICVPVGNGKGNMANKLSLTVEDNCSNTIDLQILNVLVYNNGGNLVQGKGIFEVIDNDIYVYPNAKGWSVAVTAKAMDSSGNIVTEMFYKNLLKCKK